MGNEKPEPKTPQQKNLERNAGCAALNCEGHCMKFAYTGTTDGFRTCFCGHTQNIHRHGEAENTDD